MLRKSKAQRAAANPGSEGRSANYSISVRLSEKPFSGLAGRTRAPATRALRRARPGRYKSARYCEATRDAQLIPLIIRRVRPELLLVCLTSPKHNRATRASGN